MDLRTRIKCLWPRTWEQRNNRFRLILLVAHIEELTGNDYDWYNRIIDSIEAEDYKTFCREVDQK